jgi:hypothetical protein
MTYYACCVHCEHDDDMPDDEHTVPCPEGCNDGQGVDR